MDLHPFMLPKRRLAAATLLAIAAAASALAVLPAACLGSVEENGGVDAATDAGADSNVVDASDEDAAPPPPPPVVLFETPVQNAVGREIGIIGDRVYWHLVQGGMSAIASGSTKTGGASVIVPFGPAIRAFDARGKHVVYQTSAGAFWIPGGETTARALDGAPACVAMTTALLADAAKTEYALCRTTDAIVAWTLPGGAGPVTLAESVPAGEDLAFAIWDYYSLRPAECGGSSVCNDLLLSTSGGGDGGAASGAVGRIRLLGDGGALPFSRLATTAAPPSGVFFGGAVATRGYDHQFVAWLSHDGHDGPDRASVRVFYSQGSRVDDTPLLPPTLNLFAVTTVRPNPNVWAATDSQIWFASLGGADARVMQDNLAGVGGIAAIPGLIAWTTRRGAVERLP